MTIVIESLIVGMRTLFFNISEWNRLQKICEQGYPKETCGLLFGRSDGSEGTSKRIVKAELLANILNGNHSDRLEELMRAGAISMSRERIKGGGFLEFVIDPVEHYQKVSIAQKEGLDQIGIFHSHPDHPALPSGTDSSQPFLAGWSNVIVAVHLGKFREARSWFRETENSDFQEEKILVR